MTTFVTCKSVRLSRCRPLFKLYCNWWNEPTFENIYIYINIYIYTYIYDAIIPLIMSQITGTRMFAQQLVQVNKNEKIKFRFAVPLVFASQKASNAESASLVLHQKVVHSLSESLEIFFKCFILFDLYADIVSVSILCAIRHYHHITTWLFLPKSVSGGALIKSIILFHCTIWQYVCCNWALSHGSL